MRGALATILLTLPVVCSAQPKYTMFTWVPRYDEMTVAEKIKIRTPEDWMVAVHPGTYDVETDAQALKAAGRSLGEIRDVLASLPRGARILWHVGWWNSRDGWAIPSEFAIPSQEAKQAVEKAAEELDLQLAYTPGDV
jgi:hypothetical protein